MKTEDLIAALAADTVTDTPPRAILWPALVFAIAAAVLVVWGLLGLRADLVQSLANPMSVMRYVLTGAFGALGVRLALVLARPEGRGSARLWPLVVPAAAALAMLVWAYASTPGEGRQMALVGKTMTTCLVMIPLLSVLPVAAILFSLRRGATTTPALAGFAAGLGGSGFAAMAYALYCTEDSPLFYVTWYGLAIGGVTVATTLIGTRVLRW
ncbi:DUF1109 family protein [Aliigemmobacter aestuarii]|uniref:DUF1109 family protein n=1 Tax=Aliigemmobacter aestuarii TaxID=1445661 RepID=A0A4S3MQ65_9RHOB|nr:DUF1109 domain-containing protein [Gemmobacter aestuarii]THD84670.1 DUF1109 family protein [Gemmobacter aestuarii]